MTVLECLNRLEELNHEITRVTASDSDDVTDQIIGLRSDFSAECGNLLKAMCDDPLVFGDAPLFDTLQNDLEVMRSRLSSHQQRWQGHQIEEDFATYSTASAKVFAAVNDFVSESRTKLPA